jgi:nucleotide-binding universal stress UspA family protein
MKILVPVDGSQFTKKALAFVVTHDGICGPQDEVFILHVQPPVPPRVKTMLGADAVHTYHLEEAERVLAPVREFMKRHPVQFKAEWKVGSPAAEILAAANQHGAQLIVMGTHGHGLLGRALMGSIAQRVVTGCEVPVLLVK